MTRGKVEPTLLNGAYYYTVQQFADKVGKSLQTIYKLIGKGNALRKLKTVDFLGKPMIPASELTQFPFTGPGRYPQKEVYHFTEAGIMIPCDKCSIDGYSEDNHRHE